MTHTTLTPREEKITITAILIYITVYSLEAPIRYGLAMSGLIEIILLRDLLIIGPLALIGVRQILQGRVDPVLTIFAFLILFQGTVGYVNVHSLPVVLLGTKLIINVALGLLVGGLLINLSGRRLQIVTILFILSCAGLIIEKFVTQFPWVGMSTVIGGIDVPISLDWQAGDEFSRRVGGFTRISINAASLLPFLGLVLAPKWKSVWWRTVTLLFTIFCVFLTTQKGALVAILIMSACFFLPSILRNMGLRLAVLSGVAAQIILPFATSGMLMSEGSGDVFTASSFAARVLYTWPGALRYIADHNLGPFGVGIGALGGPMRLITPSPPWMFADNMFIFVYGYLGVFSVLFYGTIVYAVWRSLRLPAHIVQAALAVLGFTMWYGVVITGIEDQVTSLGLGMSIGCILQAVVDPAPAIARPVLRPASSDRWKAKPGSQTGVS